MPEKIARIISTLFHPLLLPTAGILLLLNSGFYFDLLVWDAKRFILLVVFLTTCILPLLAVAVLSLNPRFNLLAPNSRDRFITLFGTSVFYYLGFILLQKVQAVPEFRLIMLASVLVITLLLLILIKWPISKHMASIGGLTGTLFALAFRNGVNPVYPVLMVVLVSGLLGTAQLILGKHNLKQLIAGYGLGFIVLYLVMYFV